MESQIINYLEDKYNIHINSIEKIKGSYKVVTDDKMYGAKVSQYTKEHFNYIVGVMLHLEKRGYDGIPKLIRTIDGDVQGSFNNKEVILVEWIKSRSSDYNNRKELLSVVSEIARFHIKSQGFMPDNKMLPRIYWFTWIRVFETRLKEILDFKKRINQKMYINDFDKMYLQEIDDALSSGIKAINDLKNSNYQKVMENSVFKLTVCHNDLANHNILITDDGSIKIIDFDYCILDSNIHDIASVVIRSMSGGKWDKELFQLMIQSYSKVNEILLEEINLMKGFIRFPQEFWQVGLQRYWEQLPWSEEKFHRRLNNYINDIDLRNDFINTTFK